MVFLFADTYPFIPENKDFNSLFDERASKGANFIDDPTIRTKMLDVPVPNLQVIWEGTRLRIEDKKAVEPSESKLVKEALRIYHALLPENAPLRGFGFNFDVVFQFDDVIRMQDMLSRLTSQILEIGDGLLDFGWQWTVSSKDAKQLTRYFVKVTAPLELVIHVNYHFVADRLPTEGEINMRHKIGYNSLDSVVDGFNLR